MKYGLIGEHLSHSFSKEIHEKLNSYNYELKELKPNELENFLKARDFLGFNVTIPYKRDVISFCDHIDENAKKIGAVNTIINENNKLYGYNTDFDGLLALTKKLNLDFYDKKVLILGTGGTSNTAYAVANFLKAKTILKVSRTKKDNAISYEKAYENKDADIIINTTPCGMYPNVDDTPIDLEKFNNLSLVIDVIYNPVKTKLVLKAEKLNIKAEGGLYMLVAQAVIASEIFLKKKYDENVISKIYDEIVKEKQNIVLIGMPSCGKTTIGKKLANRLNKTFIDSDEEIEKEIKMPISDFLNKYSEDEFRKKETYVLFKCALNTNCVISTGGGAVINKENIINLKQNGKVIYLKRDLDKLKIDSSRPLSSTRELLEKRFLERKEKYETLCNFEIENNKSIDDTVENILEKLNENSCN